MAIDFGQPAWITDVLDLVEARVSDVSGLTRERVFSYAGEPESLLASPPAEQFVAVWFTNLPPMPGLVAGGGAADSAWDSQLRLDVFYRLGTDRENTDAKILRSQSHGFGALVYRVLKGVQVWSGSLDAATSKFIEPSRVAGPGVTFNPRKPATGWAWARVALSVRFRTDFTAA